MSILMITLKTRWCSVSTFNNKLVDVNSNPSKENIENSEPFVAMEFELEEAAKVFYIAYASWIGFALASPGAQ